MSKSLLVNVYNLLKTVHVQKLCIAINQIITEFGNVIETSLITNAKFEKIHSILYFFKGSNDSIP